MKHRPEFVCVAGSWPEVASNRLRTLYCIAAILAVATGAARGATWYVDADAPGPANGLTWQTAFKNPQAALAAAVANDSIRVAQGTYMPDGGFTPIGGSHTVGSGLRTATFQLKNGVALMGGYAGHGTPDPDQRDINLFETRLSGDLSANDVYVDCVNNSPDCNGLGRLCAEGSCIIPDQNDENCYHVVTGSGTDATAVFDGFTITAGNANGECCLPSYNSGGGMYNDLGSPTVINCMFSGNSASASGGGIFNRLSAPGVINCTFSGNSASNGGGMDNLLGTPAVTNCTFRGNSASARGGGMFNGLSSSPAVTNCTFSGNSATEGGGMHNLDNSHPTVTNCSLSGNSANWGGGMFNFSSSPAVTNCTFGGNSATFSGGGIYNDSSSPTVTDCTFNGNSANAGGGMYNVESDAAVTNCTFSVNPAKNGGGMYNTNSSPALNNCTFSDNSATDFGGGIYTHLGSLTVLNCVFRGNSAAGSGGGMYSSSHSSPTLTNCAFEDNSARYSGGGLRTGGATLISCLFVGNSANDGGGLQTEARPSMVVNCLFGGNSAYDDGGGVRSVNTSPDSSAYFASCSFTGNRAQRGGGFYNDGGDPTLTNCMFSGNAASNVGGGICNTGGSPSLTNCTFATNTAQWGGGVLNRLGTNPTVANCIFWGDTPAGIDNSSTTEDTPTISFSNVEGGLPPGTIDGGGNIDADLLLVDADGLDNIPGTPDDDLRLGPGSPCIDAADNSAGTVSPDLDGNLRIVDDPDTPDCPQAPGTCGTAPIVDMGAYEFGSVPCGLADLDCDGDVDLRDFAKFQVCFGAIDPLPCNPTATPDLDGNGRVDVADHALFRANLNGPGL